MSVIRTTPKKIQGQLRRRFNGSKSAVRRGALAAAHRSKTMIGHHTPSDLGQLSLSWKVRSMGRDAQGKFIKTNKLAELYNDAPHAGIVEAGARPHKVSPEGWWSIYEWVERHFPEAAAEDGALDAYGNDPEFSRITWAIVRKIGRQGQKPTYFVRSRLPALVRIAQEEVGRELAKHMRKKFPSGKGSL